MQKLRRLIYQRRLTLDNLEDVFEAMDEEEARREKHRIAMAEYRKANPERMSENRKRRYEANKELHSQWRRNGAARLRQDVFRAYGGMCKYCGSEDAPTFVLVWIGPGPDPNKSSVGGSTRRYRAIRKDDFPVGYEIRCHNCHAKRVRLTPQKAQEIVDVDTFTEVMESSREF